MSPKIAVELGVREYDSFCTPCSPATLLDSGDRIAILAGESRLVVPAAHYYESVPTKRRGETSFTVPQMYVVKLDGMIVCDKGVIVTADGHDVITDSFRTYNYGNGALIDRGERRYIAQVKTSPKEFLPGTWLYMDGAKAHHYGHYLVETFSRLWALPNLPPDLGVLVSRRQWRPFMQTYLLAAGFPPERIRIADLPIKCEHLVIARQSATLRSYASPISKHLWQSIGAALEAQFAVTVGHRRLYVSRRGAPGRTMENEVEVVEFMKRRDFTIFQPELHPVAEQIAVYRGADLIVTAVGSNTFNAWFSERQPRKLLMSAGFFPPIDGLMGTVVGGDISYVCGQSVEPETHPITARWHMDLGVLSGALDEWLLQ